jgi:hypothetical protein
MKRIIVSGLIGMACGVLCAADAGPKEKITTAVRQVGNKPNYSWTTSMKEADGRPGPLGDIQGKAEKGGVMGLSFAVSGIPVDAFLKGGKGTARALQGWQTLDEIAQTSGSAAAVVRFLRAYKSPLEESAKLAASVKELKEAEGVFTGDLKEDAARELLLVGSRQKEGQEQPKTTDAKGSVKFWIKDGALCKYEISVQGKVTAGDRETAVNRTTTVEIKDAGATKLEVPEDAKTKMI